MNQLDFRVFLLLCYCCVPTECLECYACTGIADTTQCNTKQTCAPNESCFMDRVQSTHGTLFTFGCLPNQQCYNHTSSGSIIGRRDITRRQDQRCSECCTTDLCGIQLCSHLALHGGWTEWLQWGSCSVSCGAGMQRRTRNCTNPAPSRFGDHCLGDSFGIQPCLPGACLEIDCNSIKNTIGSAKSGLYNVTLWKSKTNVVVYCDMDTDGGGWTVFQRRFNGSVDFDRTFREYEVGFGQNDGEFWLGLKTIQEMTSRGKSELRIDLTAADGTNGYELLQNFYMSPGPKYTLHLGKVTGTAGDGGTGLHYSSGNNFYTPDSDNLYGCAAALHAGWWFRYCTNVNLNGEYIAPGTQGQLANGGYRGTYYHAFQKFESLKSATMMFKLSSIASL